MSGAAGAAAAGPAASSDDAEVRVSFFTRREDFAVPDTPVAVPARLRRAALSALVNHLLQLDPPVTFDFLVGGEFLRTSLGAYIESHNVFQEEILRLEVVEALPPPQPPHEHPHEDWVAAVAGLPGGGCVTGCYDHSARVWNRSGELVTTLGGHDGAVAAVAWVPGSASVDTHRCVTASHDETARLWVVDFAARTAEHVATFEGHVDAVSAVAVQPTGKLLATGGGDADIRLWTAEPDLPEAADDGGKAAGKRRRVSTVKVPVERPLGKLPGSASAVHGLCWTDRGVLCSGGQDQCVRTWDVEAGQCTRAMTGGQVVNGVARAGALGLIASADFDGAVRLYDPRSAEGGVVKAALRGHRQPCAAVAWCPSGGSAAGGPAGRTTAGGAAANAAGGGGGGEDGHLLASGSYDGPGHNLLVWDVRSQRFPLHRLEGHGDKVLAVCWPDAGAVLAGGADGRMQVHAWGGRGDDAMEEA